MITSRRVLRCSRECEKWNLWKISHTPSGPKKNWEIFFRSKNIFSKLEKNIFEILKFSIRKFPKIENFQRKKYFPLIKFQNFPSLKILRFFEKKNIFLDFQNVFFCRKKIFPKKNWITKSMLNLQENPFFALPGSLEHSGKS